MQSKLKASVIISTYNQAKWLELVLWSYQFQTERNFEIVIADDGSDGSTKSLIDKFKNNSNLTIHHIWQADNGFQKTKILNKAIVASKANYLIFTDGDCIARNDFIETHLKFQATNYVLSGGYVKLNEIISYKISKQDIETLRCFDKSWLLQNGLPKSFKLTKLTNSNIMAKSLNFCTPTKATFDGMNVSCWKTDILNVNGFDERMQYGGEDREVGERMMNYGVKFKQIRYSAICLHLHHDRPYKTQDVLQFNLKLRAKTKSRRLKWTDFGIEKSTETL